MSLRTDKGNTTTDTSVNLFSQLTDGPRAPFARFPLSYDLSNQSRAETAALAALCALRGAAPDDTPLTAPATEIARLAGLDANNLRARVINGAWCKPDSPVTVTALTQRRKLYTVATHRNYVKFPTWAVTGLDLAPVPITVLLGICAGLDHNDQHAPVTATYDQLAQRLAMDHHTVVVAVRALEAAEVIGVTRRKVVGQPMNLPNQYRIRWAPPKRVARGDQEGDARGDQWRVARGDHTYSDTDTFSDVDICIPLQNSRIGNDLEPQGIGSQHRQHRTTQNDHDLAQEVRTEVIEWCPEWSPHLAHERPRPIDMQKLAEAVKDIATELDDDDDVLTAIIEALNDPDEMDFPFEVSHPTGLLSHRLRAIKDEGRIERSHLVDGYADFEPERYTIEAPSIASTLDRLDPEQDSTYCGLMAAALTTPNLDETAKQGIAQLRATHRAMVVSA